MHDMRGARLRDARGPNNWLRIAWVTKQMAAAEGLVRTGDRHDEPLDGHMLHPGPGEGEQLAESSQFAASTPQSG